MVRINIQIEKDDARRLAARARASGMSQAAIVRELLAALPPLVEDETSLIEESFGAWRELDRSEARNTLRRLRRGRRL